MNPPLEIDAPLARAKAASAEELNILLHEATEDLLLAALENPNLNESHVSLLLERLDLSANVITAVAGQGKWAASEGIRARLARHPRTPKRIALASVGQLYLFDLVKLAMLPSAPGDIRRKAEDIILTRVPHLPVGEKLTLARRGPGRVAGGLIAEGHPQVLKLALANSFLAESQVLKILANPDVPERVVVALSEHPKWSCYYNVRVALVRNPHTPEKLVQDFLPHLTLSDLQWIAHLEDLAPHLRKSIDQDLARRGHNGQRDKGAGESSPEDSIA